MNKSENRRADFDRIARLYRWLEYITFGPLLQRTRLHFLSRLHGRRHGLLFGDGDGRFTARLLACYPELSADAVDTSATMLEILRRRAQPCLSPPLQPPSLPRLRTHNQTALTFIPKRPPDLVVTHFFLDCLTQAELDTFVQQLVPKLGPDTLWLVSEFRVPQGILSLPARLLIRTLYLAFTLLTGLGLSHLPNYASTLSQTGFTRIARHHRLFGVLTSELWHRDNSHR